MDIGKFWTYNIITRVMFSSSFSVFGNLTVFNHLVNNFNLLGVADLMI